VPDSLLTRDPERAVDALRAGRLAVLPTETVYGLGALAARPGAVARVYAVKGRPADHPLIVHLADARGMDGWVSDVPPYARRLAEHCWPGSLTLVLPRGDRAGLHVTGGQETLAVRVPDHPLTLEVLRRLADGVAAPSANLFGRVSPTTPQHVLDEVGDRLVPGADVVLDGGPCRVGVESTIVDCTTPAPRLLRPGAVVAERVEAVAGLPLARTTSAVRSPGTLPAHYAPRARVVLLEARDLPLAAAQAGRTSREGTPQTGLLAPSDVATPEGVVRLSAPATTDAYAAVLYAALRDADALQLREVLAVPPSGGGLGLAVRDRLSRSAAGSQPES